METPSLNPQQQRDLVKFNRISGALTLIYALLGELLGVVWYAAMGNTPFSNWVSGLIFAIIAAGIGWLVNAACFRSANPIFAQEADENALANLMQGFEANKSPDGAYYESAPIRQESFFGKIASVFLALLLIIFVGGWIFAASQGMLIGRNGVSSVNSVPERILFIVIFLVLISISSLRIYRSSKSESFAPGEYFKLYADHFQLFPSGILVPFANISQIFTQSVLGGRNSPSYLILSLTLKDGSKKAYKCREPHGKLAIQKYPASVLQLPTLLQQFGFAETSAGALVFQGTPSISAPVEVIRAQPRAYLGILVYIILLLGVISLVHANSYSLGSALNKQNYSTQGY